MKHDIQFTLNGQQQRLTVDSQRTLLELLRDDLKLFGAREACGMSVCGACTVLIDGVTVSSCTYLAARANGHTITTVEGLGTSDTLHPVQDAFLQAGGFQCSYCTPGMILSAVCLLEEVPNPTPDEIKDYMVGNLCRCAAYPEILQAIQLAVANHER
jgi:aerobic-type carbon monoxide dehydrogenase small subunit (CoxS/CutS family)